MQILDSAKMDNKMKKTQQKTTLSEQFQNQISKSQKEAKSILSLRIQIHDRSLPCLGT
jgi:hypothetical protein